MSGFALTVVSSSKVDFPLAKIEQLSDSVQPVREVSLLSLKELAQRLLDRRSLLRMLVLSEPDSLPREAALAKVEIFVRLLYEDKQ